MLSSGDLLYVFLICGIASILSEGECLKNGKLHDPQLNDCLKSLLESLRPKLINGIPEIDLPSLDPLVLKEVVVLPGGPGQMRAIGHNIKVTGISNWIIDDLKVDIKKLEIGIAVFFPFLKFEGMYDVDARIFGLRLEGKGPFHGSASEINGTAVLKGKFIEIKEEKYVQFVSMDVNVDVEDYNIRVDELFDDNTLLNDAVNVLLNNKEMISFLSVKPTLNNVAAKMMLDVINKIAMKLSFDKIFA